jgi:hypothetical protein
MTGARRASHARQPAWRMPLIIAVVALLAIGAGVALALALGGQGGTASESPSPTASPSPDPAETPGDSPAPTDTPDPAETPADSPEPTASPDGEVALFAPWQSVRVTVNGLAVRRGPGTDFDLVSSYRYDAGSNGEVLDEEAVRLDDGHYLWVEDGPLVIDGVPWYRVYDSLPQTEPRDEPAGWDADGDEFRADAGWVAGGSGSQAYLVPEDAPEPDGPVFGEGPEPYAIIYGSGGDATTPFSPQAPVGIRWAAAAPDGGSCTITFRLEPAGVEMASVRVDRWAIGDAFWPEDGSLPDGDQRVEVETDCTWSLRVHPIIG